MPCRTSVLRNVPNSQRGCVRPCHARRALGRSGVEKPARMLFSRLDAIEASSVTTSVPIAGRLDALDQRDDLRLRAG